MKNVEKEKLHKTDSNILTGFPVFCCVVAGYLSGFILFYTLGYSYFDFAVPDLTSVFRQAEPLRKLLTVYTYEIVFAVLILFLSLSYAAHKLCLSIIFIRGVLLGFSAIYLYGCTDNIFLYYVHTVTCSIATIVTACVCLRALIYIKKRNSKNGLTNGFIPFFLEFLFFCGLLLTLTVIRHILLMFV